MKKWRIFPQDNINVYKNLTGDGNTSGLLNPLFFAPEQSEGI